MAAPADTNILSEKLHSSAYLIKENVVSWQITPTSRHGSRNSTILVDTDFKQSSSQPWTIVSELVQLVQLSVTATALAIYYLIYCYMQLVYYTLRSAIYFHNADGPMKITIGVVTVTSIVLGFNLLVRLERLIGIIY